MTLSASEVTAYTIAVTTVIASLAAAIVNIITAFSMKRDMRDNTSLTQKAVTTLDAVHDQTQVIERQGNSRMDAAMRKIEELQQEVRRLSSERAQ